MPTHIQRKRKKSDSAYYRIPRERRVPEVYVHIPGFNRNVDINKRANFERKLHIEAEGPKNKAKGLSLGSLVFWVGGL